MHVPYSRIIEPPDGAELLRIGFTTNQIGFKWSFGVPSRPGPADWLRDEWRRRGLLKRFQLTLSGCVGSCDVPNVVVVSSEFGSQWLGNITHFDQYHSLIEWAVRSVNAGHLLELPREFEDHRLEPWR